MSLEMPAKNNGSTHVVRHEPESITDTVAEKDENASKSTFNALKNAIGEIGDAMADLAETSSTTNKEIGNEGGQPNESKPEEPANADCNALDTKNKTPLNSSAQSVENIPQESFFVAEQNADSVHNAEEGNAPATAEKIFTDNVIIEDLVKAVQDAEIVIPADKHAYVNADTNVGESENKIMTNPPYSVESKSSPSDLTTIILNETATSNQTAPLFIEMADGEKTTTVIERTETLTRTEGDQPIIVETKTTITTSIASEVNDKSIACVNAENSSTADSDEEIILAEGELDNITLGDDEYIIGEVVDVDDTASMGTVDSKGEPKKKKKLRLFKKIKRGTKAIVIDAPKAVAYGALFSAGALVGGSIVGSKAIGHGAVTGTKEIGHGIVSGTKAIGHGAQAIGHGAQDLAKNAVNAIADGSKAGAEFVTDTGDKIVVGTKEFAQNVADGTVKVAKGTKIIIVDSAEAIAYGAMYGTGAVIGGTKAIGHGVVDGTVKVAEGTLNTAGTFVKASASAVSDVMDGAKSGANTVANTANKAVNAVEDKAREALLAAVEATAAGAQFAGYSKDGRPLAIEPSKKGTK